MTEPDFRPPGYDGPNQAGDAAATRDEQPGMLRSSAVMAVGTILSRITGVVRDIAVVAAVGFGTLADVYTLGNTLPNAVYLLVVGGALGAVFVPQLVRHLKEDADKGDAYANRLLTLTMMVLLALAVVAVIAAPAIVSLYTPDVYTAQDDALATAFARFFLPQIFFYGLYTMLAQVLNSRGHFAMPMFAPIVNNIVVIGMALGFLWFAGTAVTVETISTAQVTWLGVGTTAGVVLQSLVLIPVLRRVGFSYRPRFDFRGSGLGKTAKLAGWTVLMVLANQIALLVTARLAAAANVIAQSEGEVEQGLATFDKAYLVFMLPNSVITISIVTAMLPRMSHAAAEGKLDVVGTQVSSTARLVSALIVPAAAVLVAFGPLITALVFSFGAGAGEAASYTGLVVSVFSLGLLSFGLFYMLIRGWYALSDTRSPFIVAALFNGLLVLFALIFFNLAPAGYKVASLALAETVASWLALLVAWWWLARRLGGLNTIPTAWVILRMMGAGTVAALAGYAVGAGVRQLLGGSAGVDNLNATALPWWSDAVVLAAGVATIGLVYVVLARLLRIGEITEVVGIIRQRIPIGRRS